MADFGESQPKRKSDVSATYDAYTQLRAFEKFGLAVYGHLGELHFEQQQTCDYSNFDGAPKTGPGRTMRIVCRGYGVPLFFWKHSRIRSARRRTPNLLRRLDTWNFTVRSEMFR